MIDPELKLFFADLKFNTVLKDIGRMYVVFMHNQRMEISGN